MDCVNVLHCYSLEHSLNQFAFQHTQFSPSSCSRRRRSSLRKTSSFPKPNTRKKRTPSFLDQNLEVIIDVNYIKTQTSKSLEAISNSVRSKFTQFISSGKEACNDFGTLVKLDRNRRIVISCRLSSLRFVGILVVWSCIFIAGFRALIKLGIWVGNKFGLDRSEMVIRRDRCLGGREVVVGMKKSGKNNNDRFNILGSPLVQYDVGRNPTTGTRSRAKVEEKLPKWWPVLLPPPALIVGKEEYQRRANRLIRAIMSNKISGKDVTEDDIVQLRQICRTSGVNVQMDTANARDNFYRTSVGFVLSSCSSTSHPSVAVVIGEDPRHFLAGLAQNVGLENIRAARIVSAAVAVHTRSRFLQAWALEMQNKHSEAVIELSKICCIHQIFPPEEGSAEMEMVARGLEKHLSLEERKFLLNLLLEVSGEENSHSFAEALGLML